MFGVLLCGTSKKQESVYVAFTNEPCLANAVRRGHVPKNGVRRVLQTDESRESVSHCFLERLSIYFRILSDDIQMT